MAGKGDTPRPRDPRHVQPCETVGHTEPDAKGRCLRCGAKV